MKKFLRLSVLAGVLIALSGLFISCSKDDGGGKSDKTSIVGVWKYVDITLDAENPDKPSMIDAARTMLAITNSLLKGATYEFKNDGTCFATVFGITEQLGTYTWNGNEGTLTSEEDGVVKTEKIVMSNNGILSIVTDELDQEMIEEGFTVYRASMNFKR
ncbi:MAG: hypothetical protein LBR55_03990 [Bacteroidales bacterium]|jgi:hypothetical protein|nr:hypothetical protein [Bacteroidales bacterium]